MSSGRRVFVLVAALVAAAVLSVSATHLPQLPAGVHDLAQRLPDLDRFLAPGPVLTSSLPDAVGRMGALPDDVGGGSFASLASLPRGRRGEFLLRPGRYSAVVQSFCLKAGAHAATGGDGFLAAPLKGPWAPIIEGILRNAGRLPGVSQDDVQLLLWDLLARTKVSDLPRPLQAIAAQLLSPQDLIKVNGGALGLVPQSVLDLAQDRLPDGMRKVFAAESRIRQMIADGAATYADFESVAVPDAADVRGQIAQVDEDQWIGTPQGFFVRFLPIGYQQVRVEVVVPRPIGRGARVGVAGGPQVLAIGWTRYGGQPANVPRALDLPSILVMPADTGGQRLGLSPTLSPTAEPTDDDHWTIPSPPIAPVTPTPRQSVPPINPTAPVTTTTPTTPATPATPATPVAPSTPTTPTTPAAPAPSAAPLAAAPPTAVLDVPVTAPAAGGFAASGARSFAAAGRQLVRYRWTIGDRASIDTPTATLPIGGQRIGKLEVTLQVIDDAGNISAPDSGSVIVQQLTPPTAVISVTPSTAAVNQQVVASGARSSAASGRAIAIYRWQIDGQAPTASATSSLIWFPSRIGKVNVTLTVVDDAGNVSAPDVATVIVVQTTPPTAVLDVPARVTAGQGFTANAARSSAAAGSQVVKYRWQIGEIGRTTETATPSLDVGAQPVGKLMITLVVIDDAGNVSAPAVGTVLVLERH